MTDEPKLMPGSLVFTEIECEPQSQPRFAVIYEAVEKWQRKRLRRLHADIIAAVAMGLIEYDLKNNASDTGYDYHYSIGDSDVTEIIYTLTISNVLTYGNDGLTLRVV